MWNGVTPRFRGFHGNLLLTEGQIEDGFIKQRGVLNCLTRYYYGDSSPSPAGFLVGSWGKGTQMRPPRDVDVYFELPLAVYYRFESYSGNRQSALLQEIRNVLLTTYPSTTIRGDGQVVVVRFNTVNVEVVPGFRLQNGRYLICDTHDGGRYREADPRAELTALDDADGATASNLRPLVMMLKAWQAECTVPIKSFQLELVAAAFLVRSPWRLKGYFYYDWILRDFFAYLYWCANQCVYVPGTLEAIPLGDAWRTRAETAYYQAVKACDYERADLVHLAGDEWQKIFGKQIPTLRQPTPLLTS